MKETLNKVNQVREKLTQEFNESLEKRFPKEKRQELKDKVLTNLKETRAEVESRARDLAEKSKESPLVLNYLRPFVGSEKTNEVLNQLEKVSTTAPVSRKLQSLRKQFLDMTEPKKAAEDGVTDENAPKRTATKKKASRTKPEA